MNYVGVTRNVTMTEGQLIKAFWQNNASNIESS